MNQIRSSFVLSGSLVCAVALAAGLSAAAAAPQGLQAGAPTAYFFPPGQSFDPEVPSPEEFLGYEIGSHHTRHDRIVAYTRELARLSERAAYQEIGQTHENRVMPVLTVTAPDNHVRLEEIRQQHLRAAAPTGGEASAGPGDDRPIIVHLGYGVHGNETSSSEAAMLTAYWLVAGQTSEVDRALREGVYFVEPVLNPDGRDRHTHWANMHKSYALVADPEDREHNEVWPGGRTNHYWFDLNRDWLPLVHPESRARIDFHHRWQPNVVTDYHEMGTDSTYFFEPSEPRTSWNPLLPERLYTDITVDFAEFFSASLDEIGSLYFTREVYDNMYPGYGSTYPNFLGGLGLVFEQASSRGHVQESDRLGVLPFSFAIRNHVRTSLATVRASLEHRAEMFEYQRDFFESALAEAEEYPAAAWVFGDEHDESRNRAFLDLLLRHRLEVHELAEAVEAGGREFSPGSAWVVPTRQPQFRLVRSIFERVTEFEASSFYDASTWTMSLAYGIPDGEIASRPLPLGDPVTEVPDPDGLGQVPRSGYAYLLDWSDHAAPRFLWHLFEHDVHAQAAWQPFTATTNEGEVAYPRGSIAIPVQGQTVSPERLHELILEAERFAGVRAQATETGMTVEGIDLGSGNFEPLEPPSVAMPIGDGISSYEAGQIWHLLDVRVRMPVTKIDTDDFSNADLGRYNVLVLPSGGYGALSSDRVDEIRSWVREGGTLVAVRGAAPWAVGAGLTPNIHMAEEAEDGASGEAGESGESAEAVESDPPERRDYADADAIEGAQAIGGSIWEADLDITHPVGFGYMRRRLPVWRDHDMFFASSDNPYSTVARLTEEPRLSGYISEENLERLRNSPSVLVDEYGAGAVVLLLDNPNFRGYWLGTHKLLLNAIFFGQHIDVP